MDPRISQIRENVRIAQRNLQTYEAQLAQALADCRHAWSAPLYDPIVKEGYSIPADYRRSEMYVAREETPRWTRTCRICGKTEHTQRTKEIVQKQPLF